MCVSKYVRGGPGAHKDAASLVEDGSSWLFPTHAFTSACP